MGDLEITAVPSELVAALLKAQEEYEPIKKTAVNPFFKSRYATLDEIKRCCDPALRKNGLTIIQRPQVADGALVLNTMIVHVSGECIESAYPVIPEKNTPQGLGAALTYARRYAMSAMLGVVADEDDDAEGAMGRPKKQQPTKGKGAGKTDALQIKYHTEVKGIFKDDEERHAWQLKVTGKESTKDWNATNFASAMNALRIKKLNPQVRGAEQHTTIVQLLDKLPSYTDADAPNFLDAASALIQRTISHIDELTDSEAKTVIEGLKGAVKKEGEK